MPCSCSVCLSCCQEWFQGNGFRISVPHMAVVIHEQRFWMLSLKSPACSPVYTKARQLTRCMTNSELALQDTPGQNRFPRSNKAKWKKSSVSAKALLFFTFSLRNSPSTDVMHTSGWNRRITNFPGKNVLEFWKHRWVLEDRQTDFLTPIWHSGELNPVYTSPLMCLKPRKCGQKKVFPHA